MCEGTCTSYFDNGNVSRQGKFHNGQPIDSLFKYYSNSQIQEIFISGKNGWKMIEYYNNGKIKSEYDVKKRYEKEFHNNGRLKLESKWTKKYRKTTNEYYSNGSIKASLNSKSKLRYNENTVLY